MRRLIKTPFNKSQWLALGVLAVVVGLFFLLLILPVIDMRAEYNASIENSVFRLQRMNALAAKKAFWQEQLARAQQLKDKQRQFISAETPALASAEMQAHIGKVISEANGELISTQVLPEEIEEQFQRIAIKVRMTGSSRTLRNVLYYFKVTYHDSSGPALFVKSINIRPIRINHILPGGGVAAAVEKMSFDFDVIGYMAPSEQ
jgi:general secretion pathway protein M